MALSVGEIEATLRLRDEMTARMREASASIAKVGGDFDALARQAGVAADRINKALAAVGAEIKPVDGEKLAGPFSRAEGAARGAAAGMSSYVQAQTLVARQSADNAAAIGQISQSMRDLVRAMGLASREYRAVADTAVVLGKSFRTSSGDILKVSGALGQVGDRARLNARELMALSNVALTTGLSARKAEQALGAMLGALATGRGLKTLAHEAQLSADSLRALEQGGTRGAQVLMTALAALQASGGNVARVLREMGIESGVLFKRDLEANVLRIAGAEDRLAGSLGVANAAWQVHGEASEQAASSAQKVAGAVKDQVAAAGEAAASMRTAAEGTAAHASASDRAAAANTAYVKGLRTVSAAAVETASTTATVASAIEDVSGRVESVAKAILNTYQNIHMAIADTARIVAAIPIAAAKLIQVTGAALSAGLTVPLVLARKQVFEFATGWDYAFTGVKRTVDGVVDEYYHLTEAGRRVERALRDIAIEIGKPAEEVARIAEIGGQLGIAAEGIESFTRTVGQIAIATTLSIDEAAVGIGRLSGIMGLSSDAFDELGSTIAMLGDKTKSTESEVLEFAMRIAASGKIAGLSTADILGFSAAMASVGVQAEAGGTAWNKIFSKIYEAVQDGGSQLADFARVAGMSSEAFRRAFGAAPAATITRFIEGLDALHRKGENVFAVFRDVEFDDERLKRAVLSVATAGKELSNDIGIANQEWLVNTKLLNEVAMRSQTTRVQLFQLFETVRDIAREIGLSLKPGFDILLAIARQLLEPFKLLGKAFALLPGPLQAFGLALTLAAAAAGPVMLLFGTLIKFILVTQTFAALNLALRFFSGGMKGATGAAGTFLKTTFPWITRFLEMTRITTLFWTSINVLGGVLGLVAGKVVGFVAKFIVWNFGLNLVTEGIRGTIGLVGRLLAAFVAFIGWPTAVAAALVTLAISFRPIRDLAYDAMQAIIGLVGLGFEYLIAAVQMLRVAVERTVEGLGKFWKWLTETVPIIGAVNEAIGDFVGWLHDGAQALGLMSEEGKTNKAVVIAIAGALAVMTGRAIVLGLWDMVRAFRAMSTTAGGLKAQIAAIFTGGMFGGGGGAVAAGVGRLFESMGTAYRKARAASAGLGIAVTDWADAATLEGMAAVEVASGADKVREAYTAALPSVKDLGRAFYEVAAAGGRAFRSFVNLGQSGKAAAAGLGAIKTSILTGTGAEAAKAAEGASGLERAMFRVTTTYQVAGTAVRGVREAFGDARAATDEVRAATANLGAAWAQAKPRVADLGSAVKVYATEDLAKSAAAVKAQTFLTRAWADVLGAVKPRLASLRASVADFWASLKVGEKINAFRQFAGINPLIADFQRASIAGKAWRAVLLLLVADEAAVAGATYLLGKYLYGFLPESVRARVSGFAKSLADSAKEYWAWIRGGQAAAAATDRLKSAQEGLSKALHDAVARVKAWWQGLGQGTAATAATEAQTSRLARALGAARESVRGLNFAPLIGGLRDLNVQTAAIPGRLAALSSQLRAMPASMAGFVQTKILLSAFNMTLEATEQEMAAIQATASAKLAIAEADIRSFAASVGPLVDDYNRAVAMGISGGGAVGRAGDYLNARMAAFTESITAQARALEVLGVQYQRLAIAAAEYRAEISALQAMAGPAMSVMPAGPMPAMKSVGRGYTPAVAPPRPIAGLLTEGSAIANTKIYQDLVKQAAATDSFTRSVATMSRVLGTATVAQFEFARAQKAATAATEAGAVAATGRFGGLRRALGALGATLREFWRDETGAIKLFDRIGKFGNLGTVLVADSQRIGSWRRDLTSATDQMREFKAVLAATGAESASRAVAMTGFAQAQGQLATSATATTAAIARQEGAAAGSSAAWGRLGAAAKAASANLAGVGTVARASASSMSGLAGAAQATGAAMRAAGADAAVFEGIWQNGILAGRELERRAASGAAGMAAMAGNARALAGAEQTAAATAAALAGSVGAAGAAAAVAGTRVGGFRAIIGGFGAALGTVGGLFSGVVRNFASFEGIANVVRGAFVRLYGAIGRNAPLLEFVTAGGAATQAAAGLSAVVLQSAAAWGGAGAAMSAAAVPATFLGAAWNLLRTGGILLTRVLVGNQLAMRIWGQAAEQSAMKATLMKVASTAVANAQAAMAAGLALATSGSLQEAEAAFTAAKAHYAQAAAANAAAASVFRLGGIAGIASRGVAFFAKWAGILVLVASGLAAVGVAVDSLRNKENIFVAVGRGVLEFFRELVKEIGAVIQAASGRGTEGFKGTWLEKVGDFLGVAESETKKQARLAQEQADEIKRIIEEMTGEDVIKKIRTVEAAFEQLRHSTTKAITGPQIEQFVKQFRELGEELKGKGLKLEEISPWAAELARGGTSAVIKAQVHDIVQSGKDLAFNLEKQRADMPLLAAQIGPGTATQALDAYITEYGDKMRALAVRLETLRKQHPTEPISPEGSDLLLKWGVGTSGLVAEAQKKLLALPAALAKVKAAGMDVRPVYDEVAKSFMLVEQFAGKLPPQLEAAVAADLNLAYTMEKARRAAVAMATDSLRPLDFFQKQLAAIEALVARIPPQVKMELVAQAKIEGTDEKGMAGLVSTLARGMAVEIGGAEKGVTMARTPGEVPTPKITKEQAEAAIQMVLGNVKEGAKELKKWQEVFDKITGKGAVQDLNDMAKAFAKMTPAQIAKMPTDTMKAYLDALDEADDKGQKVSDNVRRYGVMFREAFGAREVAEGVRKMARELDEAAARGTPLDQLFEKFGPDAVAAARDMRRLGLEATEGGARILAFADDYQALGDRVKASAGIRELERQIEALRGQMTAEDLFKRFGDEAMSAQEALKPFGRTLGLMVPVMTSVTDAAGRQREALLGLRMSTTWVFAAVARGKEILSQSTQSWVDNDQAIKDAADSMRQLDREFAVAASAGLSASAKGAALTAMQLGALDVRINEVTESFEKQRAAIRAKGMFDPSNYKQYEAQIAQTFVMQSKSIRNLTIEWARQDGIRIDSIKRVIAALYAQAAALRLLGFAAAAAEVDKLAEAMKRLLKDLEELKRIQAFQAMLGSLREIAGFFQGEWADVLNGLAAAGEAILKIVEAMKALKQAQTVFEKIAQGVTAFTAAIAGAIALFQIFGKITGHDAREQANKLRAEFYKTSGGLYNLRDSAKMAGASLDALYKARNPTAMQRAIDDIQGRIDRLTGALERYQLTWANLGPAQAQSGMNKAARELIADFNAMTKGGGMNADTAIRGMSDALNQLILDAVKSGAKIPRALEPILKRLIEMRLLSEDAARALLGIEAPKDLPSWQDLTDAAERYGLKIADLGPLVQQVRIKELASQVVRDWDVFTRAGANADAVLKAMAPHVQDVINTSQQLGLKMPADMKPIVDAMIKNGLLTDQFGTKLTGLDDLDWETPLVDAINTLVGKLGELIDKLNGVGTEAETAAQRWRRAWDEVIGIAVPRPMPKLPNPPPGVPPAPGPAPGPEEPNPEALGGRILAFAGGARVPRIYAAMGRVIDFRPRGTDTVAAMLTPGEGVLNTRAMRRLGDEGLNALNKGRRLPLRLVRPLFLWLGGSASGRSTVTPRLPGTTMPPRLPGGLTVPPRLPGAPPAAGGGGGSAGSVSVRLPGLEQLAATMADQPAQIARAINEGAQPAPPQVTITINVDARGASLVDPDAPQRLAAEIVSQLAAELPDEILKGGKVKTKWQMALPKAG